MNLESNFRCPCDTVPTTDNEFPESIDDTGDESEFATDREIESDEVAGLYHDLGLSADGGESDADDDYGSDDDGDCDDDFDDDGEEDEAEDEDEENESEEESGGKGEESVIPALIGGETSLSRCPSSASLFRAVRCGGSRVASGRLPSPSNPVPPIPPLLRKRSPLDPTSTIKPSSNRKKAKKV